MALWPRVDGSSASERSCPVRIGAVILTSSVLLFLLACAACGPRPVPALTSNRQQALTVLAASRAPSSPAPTTVSPGATRCMSSMLRLGLGDRVSEPTGQHSLALTLTNRSDTACVLFGYPTVALLAADGAVLPFDYRHTGDQVVTGRPPTPVLTPPGARADVTINKYRCDLGGRGQVTVVRLTPPGDSTPLLVALAPTDRNLEYCGPDDPGSVVAVSPVAPTFRDTLTRS